MAGVMDASDVGYAGHMASQKAPVLTLEACYNVQELKRGRYSVIFHGDCDVVGAPVVIKTYDRPSLMPKKQKMATREAIVLKYLKSQGVPNITTVWSAYASQDRFHIIMEHCQGGDLLERLKAAAGPISEAQLAAMVAAPLLRTLTAMHAVGVTHRDIKLENIFLDCQGNPKLGDFDLAVFHHEAPPRAPVGTIFYMAPEVLLLAGHKGSGLEGTMQARVTEKMDVWSLGVCLFELAAGYKPFQGVSYEGIASAVLQHAIADLPGHLSSSFRSFIAAALTYDPGQRPSAAQLLNHPWIQVHCPAACRSDSAGSLTDVHSSKQQKQPHVQSSSSTATNGKQQKKQSPGDEAQLWRQYHYQQQQQASSVEGCSGGCEALTHSSCSGSSITGGSSCSSSSVLKCTSDMHYGGAAGIQAAIAAGGAVALQAAGSPWTPVAPPVHSLVQQQQHAALNSVAAHAALPGLYVRSSLGTAHDWSTLDSSIACSPHSMLQRMGFSGSGSLTRQLMPWASAGSSALGLGYNLNRSASGGLCPFNSGGSGGPGSSVQQQQRQFHSMPRLVRAQHANGSQISQQPIERHQRHSCESINGNEGDSSLSPNDADGRPPTAPTPGQHLRSNSRSSSSHSSTTAAAGANAAVLRHQHQQPAAGTGNTAPGSSSSSSYHASNQLRAVADAVSPPAAATAAACQHLSPLALAVAAAVAEHNKRQPRMWTPFALRVHQMRVAQVLLAERQRQVSSNQPTPPPPPQPLMPQQGEAVSLPERDEQQPQQQRPQPKIQPVTHQLPIAQQNATATAKPPAAGMAGTRTSTSEGGVEGAAALAPQQQPSTAAGRSPPASANAMLRPLVHQMQQQLSVSVPAAGSTASSSGSAARSGVSSSHSSSSHKPPKPSKKKGFLSCFVPRAFE